MSIIPKERRSLLSSQSLVQAPYIKVTIGSYTFGVYCKGKTKAKDDQGFYYEQMKVQYPNFIQDLTIVKTNGQVNQYTLNIKYPVKQNDDPNFFEKVFSSVSKTRKITFTYGDASMPNYIYKDEEAIITKIGSNFNFGNGGTMDSVISYTVYAVSGAALGKTGSFTFLNSGKKKPSEEIRRVFFNSTYGLRNLFSGMSEANFNDLVEGKDKAVELDSKYNISPLDYITYLVGCMIPDGSTIGQLSNDMYLLAIHDDSLYDRNFHPSTVASGPYFTVKRTSSVAKHSDAYEIDIGFNSRTLVTNFSIENNENYSIYYDYASKLYPEEYVKRLNNKGEWEDKYAPIYTSNNDLRITRAEDQIWYSKLTNYPIKASITIQGLLRPATLMTYVRLNVIFPTSHKHIASGLYIVTGQTDNIGENGYKTTLKLTKISGDDDLNI